MKHDALVAHFFASELCRTQELPGASPPGPHQGLCPWTPAGALRRAPAPHPWVLALRAQKVPYFMIRTPPPQKILATGLRESIILFQKLEDITENKHFKRLTIRSVNTKLLIEKHHVQYLKWKQVFDWYRLIFQFFWRSVLYLSQKHWNVDLICIKRIVTQSVLICWQRLPKLDAQSSFLCLRLYQIKGNVVIKKFTSFIFVFHLLLYIQIYSYGLNKMCLIYLYHWKSGTNTV